MPTVTLVKKSAAKKTVAGLKAGPVVNFQLVDNGDDSCQVLGVDAAGNTADISAVATITVSSDATNILTVDPPVGVTFAMHAVGPLGAANVTAVATWTDGSKGPFTFTLPVTVIAGPVSGVQIVPGTPTVH
jgi:hypothetical protein